MKDNMMMLVVLALGGFVVWQMSKKPVQVAPPEAPFVPQWSPGDLKPPATESPGLPLDVWQRATREQLQGLPVTQQKGQVGAETYYKTSEPIAIGDTGFKIWGKTESGAVVIATRDPATYDPWEWMMS